MERTWRDMMEEPCTCSPGDGLVACEREAECYEAWYVYGRRPVPDAR